MSRRSTRAAELPPRGPALQDRRFLLSFDVGCGELVPGHQFIARGISDNGLGSGPDDVGVPVRTFSLEYELAPGIPASADRDFFRYLVGIHYSADVELPWEPTDGGAIAPFAGGAGTHGSRGSWPLPENARRLRFDLHAVLAGSTWPQDAPAGSLVVDLSERTAGWHPAT